MLKLYWRLVFRPYWITISVITASIFFSSSLDIASIAMMVPVVGFLIEPESSSSVWVSYLAEQATGIFGLRTSREVVATVGVFALVGMVVLKNCIMLLQALLVQHLGGKVELSFNVRMFDSFMRCRYDEVTRRGRGVIIADITRASDGIVGSISTAAALLNSVAMIIASAVLLAYLFWWVLPVIAIPLFLVYRYLGPTIQRRSRELGNKLHHIRQLHSVAMVDYLDGIRVVKTHAAERVATSRIEALLREYLPLYITSRLLPGIPSGVLEIVGVVMVAIIALLVVFKPDLGLTVVKLGAIILLMRRLLPSVSGLNHALIELSRLARVVEVADEVVNNLPMERSGSVSMPAGPVNQIVLRHVSFRYPGNRDVSVLDGVNLTLRRGEITALVGHTGAGKSTIADLIVRLYDPESGQILINGIDLRDLELAGWRGRCSYVGQDPYLFNTTLRNNITLWDDSIDNSKLNRAAQIAQLDEFLGSLPDGYDTIVGDRGVKLSGGQRQRVAIARAILRKPDVLIFDEATSALDNLTEQRVHTAISGLRGQAVVIIIAHRLSTVQDADQVVVFHQGRIVEKGTHKELLKFQGHFWRLYARDGVLNELPANP